MEELKPKTVVEWLNTVNYGNDDLYIPSEFALNFINFIKLVNDGEGEENKSPVLHYKMLDQIATGSNRVANLVHRGAAKTTLLAEYLFLYLGFMGGKLTDDITIEFALYVSDSIDNGVKNMKKNLKYRWENSDFLQKYIPHVNLIDTEWTFKNLDGDTFIVKGYGVKTGVRGTKAMGKRPKLAVLDDLISDDDARSPTVIQAVEEVVYKGVDYALHTQFNMIIWSGTPFNANDPLYKAVESGAWDVNVYPVCEHFPCSREEFRGSWEDRFTYDFVKGKYDNAIKAGRIDTFNQELMLRIMSDEDRLISDDDIKFYNRGNLISKKDYFNFYITTDFATSEKDSADFSVISVWALNNQGSWFWVDGICSRNNMATNLDELFRLVSKYRPQGVGVEVSGQQGGFIPWINQEMMNRNVYFNLQSIRPTTGKLSRFNIVVPLFKAGKVFFPNDMLNNKALEEGLLELSLASNSGFKSKNDDFLDTISMLSLLNIFRPSETVDYNESRGVFNLADYDDDSTSGNINSYIV